jgi:hypothetical protein
VYSSALGDNCDNYALCGAYGRCTIGNSPACGCLNRFVPKNQSEWVRADWSNGCVRRTPLNCQNEDGFMKYYNIYKFEFVISEEEIVYRESLVDKSMLWRFMTDQNDDIPSLAWIERTQSWLLYETANTDNCDRYALCGANGLCNIQSSPVCECLDGFVPKVPTDWAVTVCVNIFKPKLEYQES